MARIKLAAMTVEELIENLQDCDSDSLVVFETDYSDTCKTRQALPICGVNDMEEDERLEESVHSRSGICISKFHPDHGNYLSTWKKESENNPKVVVLVHM